MSQNDLSDAELKAYETKKASWFKGTIAVCVVYGVFAVALLAIALFDARGRQFLSEDLLPFTITFVAGMILVIILLVIQITTFKPKKLENILYDREVCPDYWKAVPATEAEMSNIASDDNSEKHLMKIKCIPDPDVFALDYKLGANSAITKITPTSLPSNGVETNLFGHKVMNAQTSGSTYNPSENKYVVYKPIGNDEVNDKLFTVADTMYGNLGIGTTSMRCDMLFPALMAKEDEVNDPEEPNKLRCKYAQLCGINWSSICS